MLDFRFILGYTAISAFEPLSFGGLIPCNLTLSSKPAESSTP